MRGRKNGCPMNVRDWLIYILDKAYAEERWVRVQGMTRLTRSMESETGDGSANADIWQEPYVIKRSARLKLSGRPVTDASTGETDAGQSLLDAYADAVGCDCDATIKFVDPYGHAMAADYIVAASEVETDDTENSVSWELMQVGEAETLPYVQVQSLGMTDGERALTVLNLHVGDAAALVKLAFTPANASNKRFRLLVSDRRCAAVSAGETRITAVSLNGQKTAVLQVKAEA